MKVLYLANVPSPYMVDYCNELGKRCDLTVLFEKETSDIRGDAWKNYKFIHFKGKILKGLRMGSASALCPQIIFYLKKQQYDYIFITNMTTPTGICAVLYLRHSKIPYFLESEGGFAKSGKGLKEKFKRFIMKDATRYFSTSPIGDEYFKMYGAPEDRFVKYPFTSIYKKDILEYADSRKTKMEIRQKLDIQEEKMIIAVGQFIYRKGFDILLRAARKIDRKTGIYFVGGLPTVEYLEMKERWQLENVHFVGYMKKDQLQEYYRAADLFVLPTREDVWGLVVNEAMACGLPVITTDRCIAGAELVENGENGYIIPIEDAEELYEKIKIILQQDKLREKMAEKSLEKMRWYTYESMADVHMEFMETMKGVTL